MAQKAVIAAVLAFVTVLCVGGAAGQSSDGCTTALMSLSPCLNYITGNETTPSSSCCSQLGTVVQAEPQCLCAVLDGGGSSLGITINKTQALALPTACKVQTPPVSKCNASGAPTGSPSTQTPSAPAAPAGGGSKTLPSSDDSGGSHAAAPVSVIISSLFAVAYFTSIVLLI